MLCYRCGSHVQDGAEKCWNCGTPLASSSKSGGASIADLRERQRTRSRLAGVVYKIGDLIANRYKVRDITGSGGAGVVYRAHDQEIDVDVAIKVVNAKLLQTGEERRLFAKESKLARKLSHQNIVRIYDEGRDGDRSFYTMQFLEGLPLRKIIDLRKSKEQSFTLPEIEPIYNQLCQALDYAHRTTYHGSLKPDNIIVLPDLLKVTDFGLLKGLPRKPFLAIQKSRGSNFQYYAPEVRLEVADLTRAVDVYSLGVVLWEMLTGTVYDDNKPEQLSIATSGVDPAMVKVVKRSVARQPKDRFQTTGELYDEIRAVLSKGDSGAVAVVSLDGKSGNPNEAPTQKLEISEHGDRPVEDTEDGGTAVKRDEQADGRSMPPPPPPASPDSEVLEAQDPLQQEGTGTFEAIDDDMIEEAAAPEAAAAVAAAAAAAAAVVATAKSKEPLEVPPLVHDDEDDLDDIDEDDEPTQAWNEMPDISSPPVSVADAAAAISSRSGIDELDEISESEIELIADPRATNVIDIGEDRLEEVRIKAEAKAIAEDDAFAEEITGDGGPVVESKGEVSPSPSESADRPLDGGVIVDLPARDTNPAPPPDSDRDDEVQLPDSAIPEPAFARIVEETTAGELVAAERDLEDTDRPSVPPVVRGSPARDGLATRDGPEEERTVGGKPLAALGSSSVKSKRPAMGRGKSNGATKGKRKSKARPMTRPRMAAMGADTLAPRPMMTPTPVVLDPTAGRTPSVPPPASIPPPPREDDKDRTPLLILLLAIVFIAVLGFMYKHFSDQQAQQLAAITAELSRMKSMEAQATQGVAEATTDANEAAVKEKAAAEAAALAAKQAEEEAAKKAAAEEAARVAEAEAAEAQKTEAAEAARAEAEKKRAEADEAARAERRALEKLEAERRTEEREARPPQRPQPRRDRDEPAPEPAAQPKRRLAEEQATIEAEREADREAADRREARAEAAAQRKAEREEAAARRAEEAAAATAAQKALEEEERRRAAADAKKKADAEAKRKAEEEAKPKAAAAVKEGDKCPRGMKLIKGGSFMMGAPRNDPERNFGDLRYQSIEVATYCVDYYEYPNGRGRMPAANVSQATASRMCSAKGKRLCTEEEWEKACKGPSGLRYPYGNQWDPARCSTEDDEGNDRTVGKTGTFTKCRSGFNIVDMAGNVSEWTSTKWGSGYVIKGGAADRPGYDSRCAARKKKKKSHSSETVGYRCCADPK